MVKNMMLKSNAAMMLLAEKDAHERSLVAARAMLAAVVHTAEWIAKTQPATTFAPRDILRAVIAQAEAAGIKAE